MGIHSDCLNLFREECKTEDALDRLWRAAVSRSPWRGAPNFDLDQDTKLTVELVHEKAKSFGVSGLTLLPPELILMIRDYSKSGMFWRYISALSFSRELSAAPINTDLSSAPTSMPLDSISAWVRGREPLSFQSPDHLPLVRLTVDSRGIRQIERLPHRPSFHPWRSDNMAFAIQEESQLKDITTQFKVMLFFKKILPKSNAV